VHHSEGFLGGSLVAGVRGIFGLLTGPAVTVYKKYNLGTAKYSMHIEMTDAVVVRGTMQRESGM
jgi:hypothetical protein